MKAKADKPNSLDALPRRAKRLYVFSTVAVVALSGLLATSVLVWHAGAPVSTSRKLTGLLLALFFVFTQVSLRSEHVYYAKMARNGCAPMPEFPRDVYGIRYLIATARSMRTHTMLQFRRDTLETIGHTFRHRNFPDAFVLITTDEPENVKAVLATRFEDWDLPKIRIRSFLPILGGHSIFTTNGPAWQHARSVLRPAFVRDQISDLACFDRHISGLIAQIPRDGSAFDLQAMFLKMTMDSISDFMFGQSTDLLGAPSAQQEEGLKFGGYFDVAMWKVALKARLGWLTLLLPDREMDEASAFLRGFVTRYVADIRSKQRDVEKSGGSPARKYVFLDELLKSGESDDVIRDHLLSIFIAGRDTTTSVLSYLFFELSRRPDVVARLREEMADLGDANPSWEDLRGLQYLNWVIKEALRLNPPVATNQREAVRDTIFPVGGGPDGKSPVFVAAGTNVRYIPWIIHRRQEFFGADAEEFRPERWEDLRTTYEYLPFNAGPRICIGQQFALTQLAMVTFRLLQAFRSIERRDDRPPIQKLGVNLSMLYGCWVSMTPA